MSKKQKLPTLDFLVESLIGGVVKVRSCDGRMIQGTLVDCKGLSTVILENCIVEPSIGESFETANIVIDNILTIEIAKEIDIKRLLSAKEKRMKMAANKYKRSKRKAGVHPEKSVIVAANVVDDKKRIKLVEDDK